MATRSYLIGLFGGDIASVIHAFFVHDGRDRSIARYGYYEEWLNIVDLSEGLKGACRGGHPELAATLMRNLIYDIDERNKYRVSLWRGGGSRGPQPIDAKFDPADEYGRYARRGGDPEVIALLNAHDDERITNISWLRAYRKGNADPIAHKASDPDWDPHDWIHQACKGGHVELIRTLIAMGTTDLNYALDGACCGGHLDIAKDLVKRGAEPDEDTLGAACRNGHVEVVRWLSGFPGILPNSFIADEVCEGKSVEIADMLVEHSPHAHNKWLHAACEKNASAIARRAIEWGATKIIEGLETAAQHGHTATIMELLRDPIADRQLAMQKAAKAALEHRHFRLVKLLADLEIARQSTI